MEFGKKTEIERPKERESRETVEEEEVTEKTIFCYSYDYASVKSMLGREVVISWPPEKKKKISAINVEDSPRFLFFSSASSLVINYCLSTIKARGE